MCVKVLIARNGPLINIFITSESESEKGKWFTSSVFHMIINRKINDNAHT